MKLHVKDERPSNRMNYNQLDVPSKCELSGEVLNNQEDNSSREKKVSKTESYRDLMRAQQRISRSLDYEQDDVLRKSKMSETGAIVMSTPAQRRLLRFFDHKNGFGAQSLQGTNSYNCTERQSDKYDRQVTRVQSQIILNQRSSVPLKPSGE